MKLKLEKSPALSTWVRSVSATVKLYLEAPTTFSKPVITGKIDSMYHSPVTYKEQQRSAHFILPHCPAVKVNDFIW